MNREYNTRVSSKNSDRFLKNVKNTTGDYFFCRTLYIKLLTLVRLSLVKGNLVDLADNRLAPVFKYLRFYRFSQPPGLLVHFESYRPSE